MTDLVFYGLKSCDTCRKARKALTEAGRSVTYIDVREDGIWVLIPEEDQAPGPAES